MLDSDILSDFLHSPERYMPMNSGLNSDFSVTSSYKLWVASHLPPLESFVKVQFPEVLGLLEVMAVEEVN